MVRFTSESSESIFTDTNEEQSLNAQLPIEVSDFGKVTELKLEHLSKVETPNVSKPSEKETDVSPVHS